MKEIHTDAFLDGLKPFQQKTVDYVFRRLFLDGSAKRFLIADEVGLGKTLVARGIIAKTIDFFKKERRTDIIYICSNATIAEQNISRLQIGRDTEFAKATRLTYLPIQVGDLRKNKVNYISLTPRTGLSLSGKRAGTAVERAILYRILYFLPWGHGERRDMLRRGLYELLKGNKQNENWDRTIENINKDDFDTSIWRDYRANILQDKTFYDRLKSCCEANDHNATSVKRENNSMIAELRRRLAEICLESLHPRLVILDEFQRFEDLLKEAKDNPTSLANLLFKSKNIRILLLSATPYKTYANALEGDDDGHFEKFIDMITFLFSGDQDRVDELKVALSDFRRAIICTEATETFKNRIQEILLEVMCRTERVNITKNQDAMIKSRMAETEVTTKDIRHACNIDRIAGLLQAGDTIEYWKSAPYLLNFLRNYKIREKFDSATQDENLVRAIKVADRQKSLLPISELRQYKEIPAANPRMRWLFEQVIESGLWKLLWIPASLPYYKPGGVYRDIGSVTKRLIFSSWKAVPDAIATLCSYEAERLMVHERMAHDRKKGKRNFTRDRLSDRISQRLIFRKDRESGMETLAWMIPWPTLANRIDPLLIAKGCSGLPSIAEVKTEAKKICNELCRKLKAKIPEYSSKAEEDKRWYWAAPALLESDREGFYSWCYNSVLLSQEDQDKEKTTGHFYELEERLRHLLDSEGNHRDGMRPWGRFPKDLPEVLSELALGAPGTCVLRALNRLSDDSSDSKEAWTGAWRISQGFRTVFNVPQNIALLDRFCKENPYWRKTLEYAISGNLQAVLDEHVHTLNESLGVRNEPFADKCDKISEHIHSSLGISTTLQIDDIGIDRKNPMPANCRFAMPFGKTTSDDEKEVKRQETVRDAFNSPFRPFVLATTSIGQEGLDFHTWCHAVVHWNLPSNPVDFEQREGRVHRYKGHAIRKNVAQCYNLTTLFEQGYQSGDPWQYLFGIAFEKSDDKNGMIPFWIFEKGDARIERHVPELPFSKEIHRLQNLKVQLAKYRLTFGQPRQEELIEILSGDDNEYERHLISLEPDPDPK